MTKIEELEEKLRKHQKKYQKLLKADKAASARYGDEFRDIQLRVLESTMAEVEKRNRFLKEKRKNGQPITDGYFYPRF